MRPSCYIRHPIRRCLKAVIDIITCYFLIIYQHDALSKPLKPLGSLLPISPPLSSCLAGIYTCISYADWIGNSKWHKQGQPSGGRKLLKHLRENTRRPPNSLLDSLCFILRLSHTIWTCPYPLLAQAPLSSALPFGLPASWCLLVMLCCGFMAQDDGCPQKFAAQGQEKVRKEIVQRTRRP